MPKSSRPDWMLNNSAKRMCRPLYNDTRIVMKSIVKEFWLAIFLCVVTVAVQGQLFKRSAELTQILKEEAIRSGHASMEHLIATAFEMSAIKMIKNGTFANAQTSDEENFYLTELDLKLTPEQMAILYPDRFRQMTGTTWSRSRRFKRASGTDAIALWPDATMPYVVNRFSWGNRDEAKILRMAMTEWEAYTCFKFKPKTSSDKYFTDIRSGKGCLSSLGFVKTSPQYIFLAEVGCRYLGIYLHELGHAMGLAHEQVRSDRDHYVRIEMNNVEPGHKHYFEKMAEGAFPKDLPYDYASIMHYSKTAFGIVDPNTKRERQTIFALDPRNDDLMGRSMLSFSDIKEINILYSCNKHCSRLPRCTNGGFVDKTCQCLCPDGNRNCQVGGRQGNRVTNCKNKHRNEMECEQWAKDLQCLLNPIYMVANCMKSCKKCHINYKGDSGRAKGNCKNPLGDEECRDLAYAYYCNINPIYMTVNCPQACGWCDRKVLTGCEDLWHNKTECQMWASIGICYDRKTWMLAHCRASCRVCSQPASCKNTYKNELECYVWASSGECSANLIFMYENCRLACGMCGDFPRPFCAPVSGNECLKRARSGDCDRDYTYMNYHCRRTCHQLMCVFGDCKNKNTDKNCAYWGKKGMCHLNPYYMWDYCKKTCKKYLCLAESEWPKNEFCINKIHICVARAAYGACVTNSAQMSRLCFRSCTRCAGPDAECVDAEEGCNVFADCVNQKRWIRPCRKTCGLCGDEGLMLVLPCENKAGEQKCIKWAKDGECNSNILWMAHNCRKACGMCDTETCFDRFGKDHCKKIKDRGHCDKPSVFYSLIAKRYCPKTCNLCDKDIDAPTRTPQGNCVDILEPRSDPNACREQGSSVCRTSTFWCRREAAGGSCDTSDEIRRKCYNTCFCDTCFNSHSDEYCNRVAALGRCDGSRYEKMECAKSCRYCDKRIKEVAQATSPPVPPTQRRPYGGKRLTEDDACCDQDEGYCAIYAEVTCRTSELTRRRCRLSCGLCTQTCKDRLQNCASFIDQCRNVMRREGMEYYCAATCNFCKPCGSRSRNVVVRK